MSSNRFGEVFSITTWGESHGKAIGVVIDGCPANIEISAEIINNELKKRAPGKSPFTSPRKEPDHAEILSGIFQGRTTGAPISIMIPNYNHDSSPYEEIKDIYRPGHSNYTYLKKYGSFDYRGGGRASARETAARVAAGAIAKALLQTVNIHIKSYLSQIGSIAIKKHDQDPYKSSIFCPDKNAEGKMTLKLKEIMKAQDSIGGVIETVINPISIGIGEPIYRKIEAVIGFAVLSIPAIKSIEFGTEDAHLYAGSEYIDPFFLDKKEIKTSSNNSGGTLGGISNGMPIVFRASCKPTSSIKQPIPSVSIDQQKAVYTTPKKGKHDPCIAIRAVPVVEAMTAIAIADLYLQGKIHKN